MEIALSILKINLNILLLLIYLKVCETTYNITATPSIGYATGLSLNIVSAICDYNMN